MSVVIIPKYTYNLAASTAYAATQLTTATQKNGRNYKGLMLTINLSAIATTDVTFTIESIDPISGTAHTLLASAAKSSAAAFHMLIYPGAVAVSNVVLNEVLPEWWRLKTSGTHATCTFSVRAELIP